MNLFFIVGLVLFTIHAITTLIFTVANQFDDFKEGIFYSSAFCVGGGIIVIMGLLMEII